MGWFQADDHDEAFDHEGFVTMVVREPDSWFWRELGLERGPAGTDDMAVPERARVRIQVGCSCGWRSHRMVPPASAEWIPFAVTMDTSTEDALRDVWLVEHRSRLLPTSWGISAQVARHRLATDRTVTS